jgi:hypothetical protein
MDRRYSQTRFYNGAAASTGSAQAREALVRDHLSRARRRHHAAQSYGGSTGGGRSALASGGLIERSRSALLKDARQVFQEQGSGALGARATLAAVRGYGSGAAGAERRPAAG